MKTTLNRIRAHLPCKSGWFTLLTSLNKTQADDEEVSIMHILKSNGLDDAIWCLRAVSGKDKEIRLFAVWCARQVQHLMTDSRSIDCLEAAERFADGLSTESDLVAASDAAYGAASDAASGAASDAAYDAARAAAGAASDAASDAAYGAARAAAGAASDAAYGAALREQEKELIRICNLTEVI